MGRRFRSPEGAVGVGERLHDSLDGVVRAARVGAREARVVGDGRVDTSRGALAGIRGGSVGVRRLGVEALPGLNIRQRGPGPAAIAAAVADLQYSSERGES